MSKILAVFGATGQQGSSVIQHVLHDPELSRTYNIRAITRNVDSEKAKQLKQKVEVVQGDVTEPESLGRALTGVHTVFAMTNPSFEPNGVEIEYNDGKTIADVAVERSAKYIIFSTLPSIADMTQGRYTKSPHFEGKAKVEKYIRGLSIKSAFFAPGFFMENFQGTIPFLAPQKAPDGTWFLSRPTPPDAKWPMIHTSGDAGKFVGAILAEPEKYEGKTFHAATALYSNEEAAAIISKATGKTVVYKQISPDEWKDSLPSFAKDAFTESFMYPAEFGFYGPDTEELVAWAAANARDKLSTLEEFLKGHPLQLS
ncbi:hypothetical protein LTR37_011556 [Vermiconidia calcicola]|uniref:Uncharacterized protein n=1 Tax=Vermiconidia calcicola TaxID=1690605 RepID=A0ACC3N2Y1_9PEZI|nr:hypothetical protein LTR37_011556 [Vermiconidia calcicola]